MRFGSKLIPGQLFQMARVEMARADSFTPESIRKHLLANGKAHFEEVSAIEHNHSIIANRVTRFCIEDMQSTGEIIGVKRGLWKKVA